MNDKSRHKTIERNCERCGKSFTTRVARIKQGYGRFCSRGCYNEHQREMGKDTLGREHALKYFSKTDGFWRVRWKDENRKQHSETYARWWWEMNRGKVPDGFYVSYADKNPGNIAPENIVLLSREEFGKRASERMKGNVHFSEETRRKMSESAKKKIITEEHRRNIGKATKKMWERGVFDTLDVREAYQKRGQELKKQYNSIRKIKFTEEMISGLGKMSDTEFSAKWSISRNSVLKMRKELKIEPFTAPTGSRRGVGAREHKIVDDIECKWCPGGHWEKLENFGACSTRYDGLRGICREHDREVSLNSYHRTNGAEKSRQWRKTKKGKTSLRNTWRKQRAKETAALISWGVEDELKAYEALDYKCAYCGTSIDLQSGELDHFYPMAAGGKTVPGNMLPCCSKCNHGKGGKFKSMPNTWLISKYGEEEGNKRFYQLCDILSSLAP